FKLVSWRVRMLAAEALSRTGSSTDAESELREVATEADDAGAVLVAREARATAARLGLDVPEPERPAPDGGAAPELVTGGERLVTLLFADVRGFTSVASATPPAELADRVEALHRWAAAEVARHHG